MMRAVGKVISRVLEPVAEIPLLLGLATLTAYLNGYRWRFLGFLFFVDVLIPGVYFLYLLKTKKAGDWDFSKRRERLGLFHLTIVMHLIGVLMAFVIDREPLAQVLLSFWLVAVVFVVITHRYKISIHAGVNSALAVFGIWLLSGWGVGDGRLWVDFQVTRAWWLLWLPVIVSWARVVYKKHTLDQVFLGALLPLVFLPLLFWLLGV